ncbi:MAG: OPT family oligopeptide transporter [Planctomycetota bacterium]
MTISQLTDEQTQTWTREQKDRWWLTTVYRGDMPQLTIRSAITGFLLGGVLTATNLYVGAKTGITLGVGLTSVILAFAIFRALASSGLAKDFTILENNAMQSIATAAGYMTMPLLSSLVAYMWVKNEVIPAYQIIFWNVVLSVMGVLVAFPMKRRFINDEQQPFPEGRACGVLLDTLYTGKSGIGVIQSRALLVAGLITSFIQFCAGEAYMRLLWMNVLRQDSFHYFNEKLYTWYYKFFATVPSIGGVDIRQLALKPSLDLAMIGTGGLMGVKITNSMMIGMVVNFVILAPWMINTGDIEAKNGGYGRAEIVNQWAIWWGVAIMVVGSLVGLFAKPKVLISAFTGMFKKRSEGEDVLRHIELPIKYSVIGLPIGAALSAWMAHEWYGVDWWLAILCLPLVFVLALICTNAMALTSWTPTGALSKITQFTFGSIQPTNPATNLMTAGITSEIASNSANLLSDIKPGYMLGAKPRQQAIGHIIGIVAGAIASTPLFFILFLDGYETAPSLQALMTEGDKFTFPGAAQWKGVSDIIASKFKGLTYSIQASLIIASVAGLLFELLRIFTKGKFPISPVSIGLGVVLPPEATFCMWIGSLIFHGLHKRYEKRPDTTGHTLWVRSLEPICAGIIAGAALTGIGDKIIDVFVFG